MTLFWNTGDEDTRITLGIAKEDGNWICWAIEDMCVIELAY